MENKSLFQLKRFRWAVIIILLAAFFSWGYIYWTSELKYVPGYEGVNGFLVIFKLPLGILALLFPAIALVAASHRSEQTKRQIVISESQNNFANYYKHLEEFEKLVELLIVKFSLSHLNYRELYRTLFPNNSPSYANFYTHGVGEQSDPELVRVVNFLNEKVKAVNDSLSSGRVSKESVLELYSAVLGVSFDFGFELKNGPEDSRFLIPPDQEYRYLLVEDHDAFKHYWQLIGFLRELNSYCLIQVEFKVPLRDKALNDFAIDVLKSIKRTMQQDPNTGAITYDD
ncbi:hypothetical protein [Halomonas sp. DWK9]|uniref:hypothetical protein n=1 Tax=Halomonas sp. DWK9 TaxID=3060155 RepID=UPI00287FD227|nr:hypothetical protein [Halomonas sp. DWK9]